MKYLLVAGEASGDLHASGLMQSIKAIDFTADFCFIGGDMMEKVARKKATLHYSDMNVMGFSEVLRKLPVIIGNFKQAKELINNYQPDITILVDYPSFNLKLARYSHKKGIPTVFYISPKIWAWKEYRIKDIRKYVDEVYSILPFEVDFYKKRGYSSITYVGNPSVKEMENAMGHLPPLRHFLQRNGIEDTTKNYIALLPGSRKGEIRNNLPLMIEAAKKFPELQYIVGAAPSIPEKFYRETAQDPGLRLVFGATPTLIKYATAALVTSGTATLETALIGTPQIVCYRANGKKISYKIMEKLLHVNYVSLPNLIVGNEIVPELLVHRCTSINIARKLSALIQPSPQRDWQISGYRSMKRKLGSSDAASYAAELIVNRIMKK